MTQHHDVFAFQTRVEEACAAAGDKGREIEAASDKNSSLRFFAVRVPTLRKVLKEQFRFGEMSETQWLDCWNHTISRCCYYEPISLGLFFYLKPDRTRIDGFWSAAKRWPDQIENWGHCDLLGGVLAAYGTHSWRNLEPLIRTWADSETVWHRRLSIVSLVHYVGKSSTYLPFPLVAELIEPNLQNPDKYISRPVGWVLREHLRADPKGMPRSFIERNWEKLPNLAKSKLKMFRDMEGLQ